MNKQKSAAKNAKKPKLLSFSESNSVESTEYICRICRILIVVVLEIIGYSFKYFEKLEVLKKLFH